MLEITSINNPTYAVNSFQSKNICPPAHSAVLLGRKNEGKEVTFKVDWDLESLEEKSGYYKILYKKILNCF